MVFGFYALSILRFERIGAYCFDYYVMRRKLRLSKPLFHHSDVGLWFAGPDSHAFANTLSGITRVCHCRRVRMRRHLPEDSPAGPALQSSFVGAARVLLHHVEQWE